MPDKNVKQIADKIRNIRELKNLTQEYVAQQIGMTQAGYSKIEMGSSDVSISKLSKIAETLDVTIEDILSFEGDRYFNSFNNVKGSNNGAIVIQVENKELKSLYEEKYRFLNKILRQTENELQKYKDRFGDI